MNKRPSFWSRMGFVILLLALATACSKPPNDAQVTADVQSKLGADSGLQNKQINVQAANGTVTLSGNVDTDAQREAASKYAASEPGVKQVINNLQVAPMAAASEPSQSESQSQSQPEPASRRRSKPSAATRHGKRSKSSDQSQEQMSQPAQPQQPAEMAAAQPPSQPAAPAPPPEPQKVTVPSGTALPVRLVDRIDSATAQVGDTFHATLDSPIAVDGQVVVPAHYDVQGHVVAAQASGKFQGRALLELQLDKIKVGEHWYNIDTDHFKQQTGSRGKNTAEKVGAGAVAGAILGGIFGGGKGAAIGSVAGAGAGGGVQAASKKPDIKLSSERLLSFTLQSAVTLVPTTKPAREGQRLDADSQP
ncbi:MAG TPA: BON domain-containing protein [Terriglobales bacterium]|nr:BON domain-containing protein [Terriglobales bacterium]